MTITDREMQRWIDEWQATEVPGAPPAEIHSYVRLRSRLLACWIAAELIVGVGGLVFVLYFTLAPSDGVHRLAMASLAAIIVAVMVFDWWNWRGTLRASGEDTATFVNLSIERLLRLRRALRVSWLVLAAQVVVFTPWLWHRLYGGDTAPTAGRQLFTWGLLIGLSSSAAVWIVLVGRWATRDTAVLQSLAGELQDGAEGRR